MHPCSATGSLRRRPGFTLVEMLVVLVLILILTALAVGFLPRLQESQRVTRGADVIQGALVITKGRALADRRPTGVRLILDPANPTQVRELQYVQQPDDFVVRPGNQWDPSITPPSRPLPVRRLRIIQQDLPAPESRRAWVAYLEGPDPSPPPPSPVPPPYADFSGGFGDIPASRPPYHPLSTWPVQAGDYLEVKGGGLVHQIVQCLPYDDSNPPRFDIRYAKVKLELANPISPLTDQPTMDYRIIRQPRLLSGEKPVQLPQSVAIDFRLSPHIPSRSVPNPPSLPVPVFEILFSPSGSVVGQGVTSNSQIILWVRDVTKDDVLDGQPSLVAINTRTGLVSAHPLNYLELSGSATGPGNPTFTVSANPQNVIRPGSYLLLDKGMPNQELAEVRTVVGTTVTVFRLTQNHSAGFSVRPVYSFAQDDRSSGL